MTHPISDVLSALSRNSQHVASVYDSEAQAMGDLPKAAVTGLRGASALLAAGEDSWRLHPHLRDYLQDHLQVFPAYQALADLGALVTQLAALQEEAELAANARDFDSMREQHNRLTGVIYDTHHFIEKNLRMLTAMLSVKYGAVGSLHAKAAQNRWYQKAAGDMSSSLNRLSKLANRLEQEADDRGWDIAKLWRLQIIRPLTEWHTRLADIQSVLRQEQYRLREVSVNLRNLSRVDAFFSQHPGWSGLEAEPPEQLPDVLLRAPGLRLRVNLDPQDDDPQVRPALEEAARHTPTKIVVRTPEPARRVRPIRDEPQAAEQPNAYQALLRAFMLSVMQAGQPVSVLQWARAPAAAAVLRPPAGTAVRPGSWLMFVVCALNGRTVRIQGKPVRFEVEEVSNPPAPGALFVQSFRDALVRVKP